MAAAAAAASGSGVTALHRLSHDGGASSLAAALVQLRQPEQQPATEALEARDKEGWTPLHAAAAAGSVDACAALLGAGHAVDAAAAAPPAAASALAAAGARQRYGAAHWAALEHERDGIAARQAAGARAVEAAEAQVAAAQAAVDGAGAALAEARTKQKAAAGGAAESTARALKDAEAEVTAAKEDTAAAEKELAGAAAALDADEEWQQVVAAREKQDQAREAYNRAVQEEKDATAQEKAGAKQNVEKMRYLLALAQTTVEREEKEAMKTEAGEKKRAAEMEKERCEGMETQASHLVKTLKDEADRLAAEAEALQEQEQEQEQPEEGPEEGSARRRAAELPPAERRRCIAALHAVMNGKALHLPRTLRPGEEAGRHYVGLPSAYPTMVSPPPPPRALPPQATDRQCARCPPRNRMPPEPARSRRGIPRPATRSRHATSSHSRRRRRGWTWPAATCS